ncbi:hypothetical protein COLO4_26605 [Corchorus olitorius]|uniref:Uncharacterized protein n=1 Tax=Corchorus olitorius TaxID=93759 RepID=A0A1R3HVN4_9ROSI|nr:hypothetical protein COLO4_26605 [Corchorus olitorius]
MEAFRVYKAKEGSVGGFKVRVFDWGKIWGNGDCDGDGELRQRHCRFEEEGARVRRRERRRGGRKK